MGSYLIFGNGKEILLAIDLVICMDNYTRRLEVKDAEKIQALALQLPPFGNK